MKKKVSVFIVLIAIMAFIFPDTNVRTILRTYAAENKITLWNCVEGNFTNSGKKEVLAFFKDTEWGYVETVFCFILDEDFKIDKQYKVPISEFVNTDSSRLDRYPIFDLGERYAFGWIDDFTGTGKKQLFIYATNGHEFFPEVFEFQNGEFKLILDCAEGRKNSLSKVDRIESVSVKDKILYVLEFYNDDAMYIKTYYVWNDAEKHFINSEVDIPYQWENDKLEKVTGPVIRMGKKYLWNPETQMLEPAN